MTQINLKDSVSLRIIIIGLLSIILLIPLLMIQGLIDERFGRFNETHTEISSKWGADQNITGPLLIVPRIRQIITPDGEKQIFKDNIYILPEELKINGNITPRIKYRGIYKTVIYTADLNFSGVFEVQKLVQLNNDPDIQWKDANIVVGISDLKGINRSLEMEWQKRKVKAIPGIKEDIMLESGISFNTPLHPDNDFKFEFRLNLNGSRDLFFAPLGKVTSVELSSEWPDPVFAGSFLPEQHTISNEGFLASWQVLNFNRNYPQHWSGNKYKLNESNFGVTFKHPVDIYLKTERTTKYAIMIISLTFLTFFMIEILSKRLLHPVQYILIGFALLIFYTLLLALAEYVGFSWSYAIAAIAIISLITSYSKSILYSRLQVVSILGILSFLYFYLFVILQLQDFALLLGSIGLFVILAIVMYLTRKVDWYNVIRK